MLYAIGNIFRFIVTSTYLDQECLNVYHYRVTSANNDDLPIESIQGLELFNRLYNEIENIQSVSVTYNQIKIINLSLAAQPFFIATIQNAIGSVGGDAYPSSVAYGFKLSVSSRKTKSGGKRFVGVPEAVGSGNSIASNQSANLAQIAFVLQDFNVISDVNDDPAIVFQPIILKKYTTDTPTVDDWQDITSCQPNFTLTTQNSRKPK